MAKIYYDQRDKLFKAATFNLTTKRVEVIDSDPDFTELGLRQGFVSDDDEECDDDNEGEEEEE